MTRWAERVILWAVIVGLLWQGYLMDQLIKRHDNELKLLYHLLFGVAGG